MESVWNSTGDEAPVFDEDGEFSVNYELPLLVLVCLLGFAGNLTTVLVYIKPRYAKSNAAVYILSLAAGDLLALVVVVFHITEFFTDTWPVLWARDWQCALHRFFRFVGFNNSVLTMTAIAVDRYYAVRRPVAFRTRFTVRRTKITAAMVWIMSMVAAVPTAFMFQSIYGGSGQAVTYPGKIPFACKLVLPFGVWFKDFKAIYLNVVLFYLPVLVTAALYVSIVLHVWRNNKFVRARMGQVPHRNSHWKTAQTLLVVFVVYVACYLILITYNLLAAYAPNALPPALKNVGLLLPYVNSCMNPLVYSFTNASFRRAAAAELFGCRRSGGRGRSGGPHSDTLSGSVPVKETDEAHCSSAAEETAATAVPAAPISVSMLVATLPPSDIASCEDTTDRRQ